MKPTKVTDSSFDADVLRAPGPVLELGRFEPARLKVLAQFGDGRVAVGVGHPELGPGHVIHGTPHFSALSSRHHAFWSRLTTITLRKYCPA